VKPDVKDLAALGKARAPRDLATGDNGQVALIAALDEL